MIFALFLLKQVATVALDVRGGKPNQGTPLVGGVARADTPDDETTREQNVKLNELYLAISEGADSFLKAEYKLCAIFIAVSFPLILILIAWGDSATQHTTSWMWKSGALSA